MIFLDSDGLVRDPEAVLSWLCETLGIVYTDALMTWPAGPHECDGPWAPWWYQNVRQSTGWQQKKQEKANDTSSPTLTQSSSYRTLPPSLYGALEASYPAYRYLFSLTRGYQMRGPPPSDLYRDDPRNQYLLVWIGAPNGHGRLIPRNLAVSVRGIPSCKEAMPRGKGSKALGFARCGWVCQ